MVLLETRILSLDYGGKRIGLAMSDPLKTFAYPFKTLSNNSSFLTSLNEIILQQGISKIIIGFPEADNTSTANVRSQIELLKSQIEKKFNMEVVLWDEAFTSAIANERILEAVPKKSRRKDKGLVDRYAASIVLQEYLDSLLKAKSE
jgi:putative Holliday junction resolvase